MSDNEHKSVEIVNTNKAVLPLLDDAEKCTLKPEYSEYNTTTNDEHGEEDDGPSHTKYVKLDNHTKVVASHYNSIEEKGLAERSKSRILYMRNFNNWVKSMLINEYLTKIKSNLQLGAPLRVMDMCCGKGGDLFKWQKGKSIVNLVS